MNSEGIQQFVHSGFREAGHLVTGAVVNEQPSVIAPHHPVGENDIVENPRAFVIGVGTEERKEAPARDTPGIITGEQDAEKAPDQSISAGVEKRFDCNGRQAY